MNGLDVLMSGLIEKSRIVRGVRSLKDMSPRAQMHLMVRNMMRRGWRLKHVSRGRGLALEPGFGPTEGRKYWPKAREFRPHSWYLDRGDRRVRISNHAIHSRGGGYEIPRTSSYSDIDLIYDRRAPKPFRIEKKVSSNVRTYTRKIRRGGLDYRPNSYKYPTTYKRGNCTNRAICEMTGEDHDLVRRQAHRRTKAQGWGRGQGNRGFFHDLHSRGYVRVNIPGRGVDFATAHKLFGDGIYGAGKVKKLSARWDFNAGRFKNGLYRRSLTHAVPVKRGTVIDHTDSLDLERKGYRVQAVWVQPSHVKGKWKPETYEDAHVPKVPMRYRLKPKVKRRKRQMSAKREAEFQELAEEMGLGKFRKPGETFKQMMTRYKRAVRAQARARGLRNIRIGG